MSPSLKISNFYLTGWWAKFIAKRKLVDLDFNNGSKNRSWEYVHISRASVLAFSLFGSTTEGNLIFFSLPERKWLLQASYKGEKNGKE